MTVYLHEGDIPSGIFAPGASIAVDTETLGLNPHRDRLCVVQVSRGNGTAEVVQIPRDGPRPERLAGIVTVDYDWLAANRAAVLNRFNAWVSA